jgi:hypothetical protein
MKDSLYRIILKGTRKTLKEGKINISEKKSYEFKKYDLENSVKETKVYNENYQWSYNNAKYEKNISVKMRTQGCLFLFFPFKIFIFFFPIF